LSKRMAFEKDALLSDPPKEFQFRRFDLDSGGPKTFNGLLTEFSPKKYSPQFSEHLKELEMKALKQVQEKSFHVEKEAYEKGFAQGEKDGMELGQKRFEGMIHQLGNLLAEIENRREELYRKYEEDMVRTVLAVARKVVHHGLETYEDAVALNLQEAFRHVLHSKKVVLHVNPADYRYLASLPEGLSSTLGDLERVKVVEDGSVTRGGCLLETSFGEIDATVESQFEEIVSLIWKSPGERPSGEEREG
jgi:flagellar assembly protein FliH